MVVLAIILTLSSIIAWRLVKGISYMDKHHPDYKGDDLFGDFDEDDKTEII